MERWQPLFDAAKEPGIVVQLGEGGVIKFIPLPDDGPAAIAALKALIEPAAKTVSKLLRIDDSNYRQFVGQRATGYVKKSIKLYSLPRLEASFPVIPRSQWAQLVKEGQGTFLSDLAKAKHLPVYNQDGENYCWAFASTSVAHLVALAQGQPWPKLSAESVGGPVVSWRNVGGDGRDALQQLTDVGACAASFMDSANSLLPRRWKSGWQADCANHTVDASWATIDDGGFDTVFSALIYRMPVSIGLDWWGHQVMLTDPYVFSDGSYGVVMRNSWGPDWPTAGADGWSTLTESKSQPSGSFACISVAFNDKEINNKQRGTAVDLARLRQASIKKAIETNYQQAP
jgi:hypothetical protein